MDPGDLSIVIIEQSGSVIMICFILVLLICLAGAVFQLLNRYEQNHRDRTWLEITPPASINKTPASTEHLFSVIHGDRAARSFNDKLLRRLPITSFEIVSTRQEGIRYLVQVESGRSTNLQKTIASYIPHSKVKEVDPPLPKTGSVIEFAQTKHYILPLLSTHPFEQHDPMSYITGAMTKLEDNEQITVQLIVVPVSLREARQLSKRILGNEDILQRVQQGNISFIYKLFEGVGDLLRSGAELTGELFSSTSYGQRQQKPGGKDMQHISQVKQGLRPARTLSTFEQELMESMHKKLTKPLFQVNLRVTTTSDQSKEYLMSLRSAFNAYSMPPYQELRTKPRVPLLNNYRKRLADQRLPSLLRRQAMILSSTELASMYHFPSTQISQTDNLVTSLSRTLPAPISLKQTRHLDVLIGQNEHHNTSTPIGLTGQERERHVYIIGGTGNGKTTMLQYSIVQDIQNGRGVAVVDPHGDMAETLLRHIPEDRIQDVIYFNPDDLEHPIGLNLLELTPGLSGNDLLREKDIITESVVSVFRKIFSDKDTGGHRIEYILRNTVHTALTVEDATLFTVYDLLNDSTYRKAVVKTLEDDNLRNFWDNEFAKAGNMQKVKMAAGITAKIGRFLFSASARQILEQPHSTIDFNDIINQGKILICNFSKGRLGEDTSELFGITVLAKLQLASLRRARISQKQRRPFYLYVDEFQNFATPSFVQMLSESRKYKLCLIMAEQSTSQQDDQQMVSIILANVGTVICFRTGNPNDERLLLPLFSPYIGQGEISNLSAYNFYVKLSAIQSQEPLSGVTVILNDEGSEKVAKRVIEQSQDTYTRKLEKISDLGSKTILKTRTRTIKNSSPEPTQNEHMLDVT